MRRCAPLPRRGADFFVTGKPGPKTAPGKDAARPRILELRAAGHSIDEIAQALAAEGRPLNRTGIAEVIADEGLPWLWRRPDAERGGVAREIQARAEALLTALPKDTALTAYSCRLEHSRQAAFLAALDRASLAAGLASGEALNLDFHAVMHWGEDAALERHYVPSRSQRTRSVLTFFAEDAGTHTLLYANADLSRASQNREVIAFADHWKAVTGANPSLLIFDSKLTTQAVLAELDDRHIGFITLRARHPGVTKALAGRPASAWASMTSDGRRADPPRPRPRRPRRAVVGLPPPDPPARRHRPGTRPAHPPDHQPAPAPGPPGHPDLRPADEHRTAPRPSHPLLPP